MDIIMEEQLKDFECLGISCPHEISEKHYVILESNLISLLEKEVKNGDNK